MTVSDPVVEAVFDPSARLMLQVPVRWKDRPGTVRAEMAVSNVRAMPLLVGMQVTKAKPWKPTVYLMLENEQLRRLDINGSHTNRTPRGSSGYAGRTSMSGARHTTMRSRTRRAASQMLPWVT